MDLLAEFRGVKRRTLLLQGMLLPSSPPGAKGYSRRQQDLISSYVLLVHAEIEGYLEFCAQEAADRLSTAWDNKVIRNTLSKLVFFHHSFAEKGEICQLNDRSVKKAINFYLGTIDSNHGVKTKNIYSLFFPLGFVHNDFDSVWLSTMDSFGVRRGDSAHTWVKTRQQINPRDVSIDVNKIIVPELRNIALKVDRLK